MRKIELTISRNAFIISKIIYSILALFLTIGILITLKKLFSNNMVDIMNIVSINFILPLIGFIIFCLIDYFVIRTIVVSKMLYYDDSGIIAGPKKISWDIIVNAKITFGQSPVLKIAFTDNGNVENVFGLLRVYPSKSYLNSIKEVFQKKGVTVGKSFI
jgi:hypothetical protein